MITLAQAEVGKVYTVESVQADVQTKKHLNNLGVVAGQAVVLVNYQNQNGIVLLHNCRFALTDRSFQAIHVADPIEINVRGYELTLRKSEAELILVEKEESE